MHAENHRVLFLKETYMRDHHLQTSDETGYSAPQPFFVSSRVTTKQQAFISGFPVSKYKLIFKKN